MRSLEETNSINRVLKAWGLGSLDEPGAIQALAYMVQDHEHFSELLRACDPELRRHMYEAMSPNLRFPPNTLDWYLMRAKQHAETMQFPTLQPDGNLKPYMMPSAGSAPVLAPPEEKLIVECSKCKAINFFYGARRVDAIVQAREAGWAYDEAEKKHLCAECLEKLVAQDKEGG